MDTPAQRGCPDDVAPDRQQRDLAAPSCDVPPAAGHRDRLDDGPPARPTLRLVAVRGLCHVLDRQAGLSVAGQPAGARRRRSGAGARRNLRQAPGAPPAVDAAAPDVATGAGRSGHAARSTRGGRRRPTPTTRPDPARPSRNPTGAMLTSGRPRSTTRASEKAGYAGAGVGIAPDR